MLDASDSQSILNLVEDAVFIYPVNENGIPGNYMCVNDWVCEKYGYTRDEFMNMSPLHINDNDSAKERYLPALKELSYKKIVTFESTHITKSGDRIQVEGHIKNISFVGKAAVISVVRDITEHKRVEQALRDFGKKFEAVFEATTDLIAITRYSDGKILDVNGGYSQLLGYSHDESIGKTTAELNIWVNPADRVVLITKLKETGLVLDFETSLRRKDGAFLFVLDSAKIFDYQGEKCILSIAHDITKRKNTEESMKKAKDELQRKVDELEKINKVTINREIKMIELKNKIKDLEEKLQ